MTVMNLTAFTASLDKKQPPKDLALPLQALWWDAKGDWNKAHECAQADEADPPNQWVHAYLHRKEGDQSNAKYWYTKCGRKPSKDSLEEEWRAIVRVLLEA
jgi:hypothetical protein